MFIKASAQAVAANAFANLRLERRLDERCESAPAREIRIVRPSAGFEIVVADPDDDATDAMKDNDLENDAKHGVVERATVAEVFAQAVKHRMVGIGRYRHGVE